MSMSNLLAVLAVNVVFAFGSVAAEPKGESVDQKSLPAAVQKTVKEKAAGGKIVRIQREDDANGKWNYEVTVKSSQGKEVKLEIAPNGKFVKQQ